MLIENHRLVGLERPIRFEPDDHGGPLLPEIVTIHYAVTQRVRTTVSTLRERQYVSCHVAIDSTGEVVQMVPFDRVAWHAGESSYRGRVDCNRFSLGIEVSNPGPLVKGADGLLRTTYGVVWTGEAIEARHVNKGAPSSWTHWAAFSETEIDTVAELCELFRQTYKINDAVGHDEISPGRKFDPGPAFPMAWLRDAVFLGRP